MNYETNDHSGILDDSRADLYWWRQMSPSEFVAYVEGEVAAGRRNAELGPFKRR